MGVEKMAAVPTQCCQQNRDRISSDRETEVELVK